MTEIIRQEEVQIRNSEDVVIVRQLVRAAAVKLTFSVVEQTKVITAASELARNALEYGGGGFMQLSELQRESRRGLKLDFIDQGPGIADIERAMTDGYTSGGGLGLGLSGAKRLSDEFEIVSKVGEGTRVSITRWK